MTDKQPQPQGDAAMPVDCWRTPEHSAWSHEEGAHGRGTACTVALVTLADAQAAIAARDAEIERLNLEVEVLAGRAARRPAPEAAQPADTEAQVQEALDKAEAYGDACKAEARNEFRRGHELQAGHPQYDLADIWAGLESAIRRLVGGK